MKRLLTALAAVAVLYALSYWYTIADNSPDKFNDPPAHLSALACTAIASNVCWLTLALIRCLANRRRPT